MTTTAMVEGYISNGIISVLDISQKETENTGFPEGLNIFFRLVSEENNRVLRVYCHPIDNVYQEYIDRIIFVKDTIDLTKKCYLKGVIKGDKNKGDSNIDFIFNEICFEGGEPL